MLVCPKCGHVPRDADEAQYGTCSQCDGELQEVSPDLPPGREPKFKPGDSAVVTGNPSDADEGEDADEDADEEDEAEELGKDDEDGDDEEEDERKRAAHLSSDDMDASEAEHRRVGSEATKKMSLMQRHKNKRAGGPMVDGVRQAPRRKSRSGGRLDGQRLD